MKATTALLALMLMGTFSAVATPEAAATYCIPPNIDCAQDTVNTNVDWAQRQANGTVEWAQRQIDCINHGC